MANVEDEEQELTTKTIEQWGEELGYLPETRSVEVTRGPRKIKIARANPDAWKFTAAKAHARWPEGKEVTKAEFEAAVAAAAGVRAL